jgi:hypothetical protein
MPFMPGQSGNPRGKRPGARNVRTVLALQAIAADRAALEKDRSDHPTLDPLDFLLSVGSHPGLDMVLRAQAMIAALRETARTIRHKIRIPEPTTVQQATANIAKISTLAAAGRISLSEAEALANLQRTFVEATIGLNAEGEMAALREDVERISASVARTVEATVIGGLPVPRGFEWVKMPVLGPPANGGDPEDSS